MKKIILAGLMLLGSVAMANATVIDFESQALGDYSNLTIGNVTFSGNLTVSNDGNNQYVPPPSVFLDNRNGGDFTFDFLTDVSAFGLKIGASNFTQYLYAYDGANNLLQTVVIPDQVGSLTYPFTGVYGINLGSSIISKAVLTGLSDWIVIDDFTYNESSTVPEPGTMMLLGIGMAGLAIYGKRRKNSKV